MKSSHKKECIKLYGLSGEIFEENLIPFIPKVLNHFHKRIKEGDSSLHVAISDSLGILVHHLLKKVDEDQAIDISQAILKTLFTLLSSPNKNVQLGASMCLTRFIQNSPVEVILKILELTLSTKILELFGNQNFKCHA
jgi:hypothetical protein